MPSSAAPSWRTTGRLLPVDAAAWVVGTLVATGLRLDLQVGATAPVSGVVLTVALAVTLHVGLGRVVGLYRGRHSPASFDEVAALGLVVAAVVLVLLAVGLVAPLLPLAERPVPLSVPPAAGAAALAAMLLPRAALRLHRDRPPPPDPAAQPVVVIGAGDAGRQLVRDLQRHPELGHRPVAVLDDDPAKRHRSVCGVPVRGTRDALADVARETGARTVIIAIARADAALVRELSALADDAGLAVKVVPTVAEVVDGVRAADVRDVEPLDMLGRSQVEIDLDPVVRLVRGRRVLVTGAGGSIGAELCRQLHRCGPAQLLMLDRDESALHAVQLSLHGRALLDGAVDGADTVLADVRDPERLVELFRRHRPDLVVHAAALKHLPVLERYPAEAVKTNVHGTAHVLRAAEVAGVERFVNISTDKAADPSSVLGASKRIAERLTAESAVRTGRTYLSVRFGNVLGSRGSVLTTFAAQVAAGGPITVTDERVTRYFMTVAEAVQLSLVAAAVGEAGEVLVLDMGEPVPIVDVARRMAHRAARPLDIVFTGLRPGEKLHEELLAAGEADRRPCHPLITQVPVPPLDRRALAALDGLDGDRLRIALHHASAASAPTPVGAAR